MLFQPLGNVEIGDPADLEVPKQVAVVNLVMTYGALSAKWLDRNHLLWNLGGKGKKMYDSQTYVGLPRLSHISVYGSSDFGPKYYLLAEHKP